MTNFWYASKRVGKGGRIGIGSTLSSSKRPTVYELRKQEKSDFISGTEKRMDDLVKTYFLSHGYVVLANDAINSNLEIAAPILPYIAEFYKTHRLVKDGGNLTDKRKEALLEQTYAVEEIVNKIETVHPIKSLYDQIDKLNGEALGGGCLGILLGFAGFYYTPLFALFLVSPAMYVYSISKIVKVKDEINQKAIKVISKL